MNPVGGLPGRRNHQGGGAGPKLPLVAARSGGPSGRYWLLSRDASPVSPPACPPTPARIPKERNKISARYEEGKRLTSEDRKAIPGIF